MKLLRDRRDQPESADVRIVRRFVVEKLMKRP